MSYSVNGTSITVTRGDTLKLIVGITANGKPYTPTEGDAIRFALKETYSDPTPILEKTIPTASLLLWLTPTETKQLVASKYVYDIQMTYASGDVDTFIKGTLKVTEEVE